MHVAAGVASGLFWVFRLTPLSLLTGAAGWAGRTFGHLMPRNDLALDNLKKAFPEKSEAECRAIRRAMWDHLFRTVVEGARIDRFWDVNPDTGRGARMTVEGGEHILALRDDGLPGILFTAHLGNWELLPAGAARFGVEIASLYRPPSITPFAKLIERTRQRTMRGLVASRPGAALDLAAVLGRAGHIGLLVDQKFINRSKVRVTFFGRPANANPLLAKLARRFECPVHAARVIRLPGGRHRIEVSPQIDLPRDYSGHVDIIRATQHVTSIVEDWVREHPEQWLWIHRRWSL